MAPYSNTGETAGHNAISGTQPIPSIES